MENVLPISPRARRSSVVRTKFESAIPAPPPPGQQLSPARAELARAIDLVDEARREAEVAAGPARRLHEVVHKLEWAENELATLRGEDERGLAQWLIAGAEGPRPEPSPATLEAEQKYVEAARDGAAARNALPLAENVHQTAIRRLTAAGRQRQDAGFRAAVEAAEDYLAGPFTAALVTFLHCDTKVRSVEAALHAAGHGADPSPVALGCAAGLGEAIAAMRRSAGVPHDITTGPALLEVLMADPTATLS
jgi:hypothetical protein